MGIPAERDIVGGPVYLLPILPALLRFDSPQEP